MDDDLAADPGRLLELIGAGWTTQVVRAAVELGVVDALIGGPRRVADVARELDVDGGALGRLVRALCSLELCTEVRVGGDEVALTPTGALLASGEGSLGPWSLWWGGPAWAEWGELPEAVRSGRPVRGGDGFDALATDPGRRELFDAAMAGLSALEAPAVVEALALRGTELVVDLGGGSGALLRAVLVRHPEARGLLVDLAPAVAAASARLAGWGLAARCDAVVGDLFEAVPSGGDAYVLKSVLHDWDDDGARRLLARCAAGAGPAARVLIVERLAPGAAAATSEARSTARMDLHMLVAQGGRERTELELRELVASAGLRVTDVRRCTATLAVVEAIVDGAADRGSGSAQPEG